jgi:hypothetical protein
MNAEQYLDALLALPVGWGDPLVSHDGRWVAWTWAGAAPHADVYAAPTDGSAPPVRLISSEENTTLVSPGRRTAGRCWCSRITRATSAPGCSGWTWNSQG